MSTTLLEIKIPAIFSVVPEIKILLKNINLSIPKTGLHALIGSSGSGKSLFFSILTATKFKSVLIDKKASITVNDDLVLSMDEYNSFIKRKKFFYLFIDQNYNQALDENLTVRENILLLNKQITIEEINSIFNEFNLTTKILYSKIKEISGGQLQRFVLITTLLLPKTPELIILDEVTSALDYENEVIIWKILTKISKKCSIIVTTHNLNLAVFFANSFFTIKNKEVNLVFREDDE